MVPVLAVKETAQEAWEAIRLLRMGVNRAREATAQRLRKEFEQITFKDGETLDAFGMRITTLANNLRSLGDTVEEVKIIQKFLREVPDQYSQMACSIETLLDINGMSVEELIGRLRSSAERCSGSTKDTSNGQLLLTEEEWMARVKQREQGQGSGSGNGKEKQKGKGKQQYRSRDGGRRDSGGGDRDMSKVKCYNCNKYQNHFSRDCPEPRRERREQVHLSQNHVEEPTLLITSVCTLTEGPKHPIEHVMLNEEDSKACAAEAGNTCDTSWFLDTGASNHMSGRRDIFSELDTGIGGSVKLGDGSTVDIQGRGTILFQCKNGEHLVLTEVYFIPRLRNNIVSIGQLDEIEYETRIRRGVLELREPGGRLLARVPRTHGRLYILNLNLAHPVCLAMHSGEEAWRWHARYGHIGFQALRRLAREDMVHGLLLVNEADRVCEACLAGKHRRAPFPRQALNRAGQVLELVHADLCGPISPPTPGGKRYFLLLVDDKSRYMWLRLLTTKDEAQEALKQFQAAAELESGQRLKTLRTDRGGQFTSASLGKYFADQGVQRQLTAPYTPQQNGVVECRNQTIVGMADTSQTYL
jgi:hypothetical protein